MPPEQDSARLRAGLQALDLWPVDREHQHALTSEIFDYLDRLQRWNRRHNLTAVRDPAQMLVHHILDCAAVVPVLQKWVQSRDVATPRPHIIDVGSGAGLPGIVLAWFWPQARITLVEPTAKRVAFLQQATATPLLAQVEVIRARIEEVEIDEVPADAIICRAFSSLAEYVRAVAHLAGPATVVAAMKARLDSTEKRALTHDIPEPRKRAYGPASGLPPDTASAVSQTPAHWMVAEETPLQVPEMDAQRCLVRLVQVHHDEPPPSSRQPPASLTPTEMATPDQEKP